MASELLEAWLRKARIPGIILFRVKTPAIREKRVIVVEHVGGE